MKADSGSWLYIILSIVFLVLSAIGNKNKKKATTSTEPINDDYEPETTSTDRRWPRNLDEVLTEVLDMPKPRETSIERPVSRPVETVLESTQNTYEKIEDEAQSLETIEEETFSYETPVVEKKADLPYFQKPSPIETDTKTEEEAPILMASGFNLRDGIIYAEILNRKYF